MAGDRGRGRRGQVPTEEVQHQDCNAQDEMIEDLQRQVAELTQRLAAQDIDDREEEDLAYESSLENPYHRPPHHPRPFHREYRGREESQWSLSFRVDLPEFAGTLHAEGFIDWLDEVERIFDYKEVPNHMKVKIVALKLKGRASAWWEHLKRLRERHGKEKIKDWEKMKKKMKKYFLPFGYTSTLFQRLHSLRREKRSVDVYIEEFRHIRQPLQGKIFNPNITDEFRHIATSYKKALIIEEEVIGKTSDPIYDVEKDVEENFEIMGEPIYDVYDDEEDVDVLYEDAFYEDVNTMNIWDTSTHEGWTGGNTVDVASDDHHKYKDDIKFINNIGAEFNGVVREVLPKEIILNDGTSVSYGIMLWSTGVGPSQFIESLQLPKSPDRMIDVDKWLHVPLMDDIFALRGCATFVEQTVRLVLPVLAQVVERPWQYDHNIIFNCQKNIYSPRINVKWIMLAPCRKQLIDELLNLVPKDLPPGLPPEEHIFNVKYLSHCLGDPDEATVNSRTSSFQPGVTDAGRFWPDMLRWRINTKKEEYIYILVN